MPRGMSRVTHRRIITRTWMHHVTEEWVMLRMDVSCHIKESCHIWMHQIHVLYRYKMRLHVEMSRVASYHEYECIMSYEWVMSHLDASSPCIIYIQHETSRRNESCCVRSRIWWMPHIIWVCHEKQSHYSYSIVEKESQKNGTKLKNASYQVWINQMDESQKFFHHCCNDS